MVRMETGDRCLTVELKEMVERNKVSKNNAKANLFTSHILYPKATLSTTQSTGNRC